MTDQPKRTNWMAWLAIACAAISVYMCWWGFNQRAELANHESKDHETLKLWHNQVLRKDIELAEQDTIISTVRAWKDSITHHYDSVIKRRNATISRLSSRRLPVQVIIDADSLELTRAQLEDRDSTIDQQALNIVDLKEKIGLDHEADSIEDRAYERKVKALRNYSILVGRQRDSTARENRKIVKKLDRNIVISVGASATATEDGMSYGPSINVGYRIASFRLGKRK